MTNSAQWQFAEGRVTFLPPRGAQLDTGDAAAHLAEHFLGFVRRDSRYGIEVDRYQAISLIKTSCPRPNL